ncbi:MAG: SusC/RagA family TonB-linked outer membrane protein [Bacteroidetes bacterium]|nr:MAG: SusC/RagA family TonB-linked outer membrane protein [Bacteroidota bacterium]
MKIKLLTKLLLLPFLLVMGGSAFAQLTVSGTVSDTDGIVPGVNIIEKGTSNGAQSDFDGNYTITDVADDATLVFSYIGYTTMEVAVNGQSNISVTLQTDVEALSEVIVIGYGTTTIKDATGAVASVSSKDFNRGVIVSVEQLIQGKLAGVQITQSSGEPGAGIDIRIRGANSIRSNNNPLFVVDGIPLHGANTTAEGSDVGFGSSSAKNPLNFLNPNDIESISVLKDASATAIYGSRGANGVVIITTKSGKGKAGGSWEYNTSLSIAEVPENYDLLSAKAYLAQTERFGFSVAERDFKNSTDWQEFVFRTSTSTNNGLSYSNNYGDGNVRATFGYSKDFGVVKNSSLERIVGRVNASHRFVDNKLRLGFQGSISRVNDESSPISGSAGFRGDLLGSAYSANPTWPTDPDFDGTGGLLSPATALAYTENLTHTDRYLVSASIEYDIVPELTAKVNLGYDRSESTRSAVANLKARNFGQGVFGNGSGIINELTIQSKLMELTLNYKTDFGNSNLDIIGGYAFQDFDRYGKNIFGWGFFTADMNQMVRDLKETANAIEGRIIGAYQQYGYAGNRPEGIFINRLGLDNRDGMGNAQPTTDFIFPFAGLKTRSLFTDTFNTTDEGESYFARVNYTIADRYLFTGTIRADSSSRFGSGNETGYFPSGAFAWNIHEEDFAGENLSILKIRVGVGITGNQEGLGYGNFVTRRRYAGGDIIGDGGDINIPGLDNVSFAEPGLKWEETLQYNIGLDFGFNNDKVSGSLDVYRKETSDLLFQTTSAQPAAQPFQFRNLPGSLVVNEGVEFSFAWNIFDKENFSWELSFNVAYNDNLVKELLGEFDTGTIRGQGLSLAFAQKLQAGQPLFSYFLRKFEGFDPVTGQPIQTDVQEFVGKTALPDVTGGFSTSARVDNWTFSLYFAGQFGHYIYNNTTNAFFTAGAFRGGRNVPLEVLNAGESLDAAAEVSTRFLESGDFVRLQNASVTWAWPLKEDSFFSSMILSITGQNLFVITDYSGLDPEVSTTPGGGDLLNGLPTAGIDYTSFPRPRIYTLGLNLKF